MLKDLESLIGLFNHVCKVTWPGRSLLRRMIDLLHGLQARRRRISYNPHELGFRSDRHGGREFITSWNGIAFLSPSPPPPPPGNSPPLRYGNGYFRFLGMWSMTAAWDGQSRDLDISNKELFPIILACATWDRHSWTGHHVTCHCANQVVVACPSSLSLSLKQAGIMHLLVSCTCWYHAPAEVPGL